MHLYTFVREASWDADLDQPATVRGSLPLRLTLPSGECVDLDFGAIDRAAREMGEHNGAMRQGKRQTFLLLHPQVRIRCASTCVYDAEEGKSRDQWEIQAPEKTRFGFAAFCPWCGQRSGETELSEEEAHGDPPSLFHAACAQRMEAFEQCIEQRKSTGGP